MQNQTPEIQAKLLAMQRMIQNPSASSVPAPPPVVERPQSVVERPQPVVAAAPPVQQPDPAAKQMTQEQREDRMRYHCLVTCCLNMTVTEYVNFWFEYCGIILNHQSSWVTKILLVCGDIISYISNEYKCN
jgi:hypothetical protein